MNVVRLIPRVTMDPSAYLPSTWRMAKGALLTNHRITHYTRLGFYGKDAQERATKRVGLRPCEKCGTCYAVFMRYSYLPKAMWCCEKCRQIFKLDHEKAEELSKAMRQRIREANKAIRAEVDSRREAKHALNMIEFE